MFSWFYDGDDDVIERRRIRTLKRRIRRKVSKAKKKARKEAQVIRNIECGQGEVEPGYGFGV